MDSESVDRDVWLNEIGHRLETSPARELLILRGVDASTLLAVATLDARTADRRGRITLSHKQAAKRLEISPTTVARVHAVLIELGALVIHGFWPARRAPIRFLRRPPRGLWLAM